MAKAMTPKAFLTAALEKVESKSIREWATSTHNYPIILKMAAKPAKAGEDPTRFATYLVCVAMGF